MFETNCCTNLVRVTNRQNQSLFNWRRANSNIPLPHPLVSLTIHSRNKTTASSLRTKQWHLPDLCAARKNWAHVFFPGWTSAVCRVCWCPSVSKRFISVISFLSFVNLEGDIVSESHCLLCFWSVELCENVLFTSLVISVNLRYAPLDFLRKSVYRKCLRTASKWLSYIVSYFLPLFF